MSDQIPQTKTDKLMDLSEDKLLKARQKEERRKAFEAKRNESKEISSKQVTEKTKSELKAERRAKQDAQRSTKTAKINVTENMNTPKITNDNIKKLEKLNFEDTVRKTIEKTETITTTTINNSINVNSGLVMKKHQIFAHIPQRIYEITSSKNELRVNGLPIHASVIQIGFKINKNIIAGSNARCVSMLIAFKNVIQDYITPPSKELTRDLEAKINSYVEFLAKCRPLSISMTNAVKFLKLTFSRIPSNTSDANAKNELTKSIDNFIYDEIICAQKAISMMAITKVNDNDVILTFGCSLIIKHVLYRAAQRGKKFRVVVVDSRPRFDGREMLKYLLQHNISATYIFINAVSYVMKEVTKVLLGAHSLLANGYVMSHIGTSQIALVAHSHNVPVMMCCETYKFSERVLTDSFVHNELGDNRDFLNSLTSTSKSQFDNYGKELSTLDLLYDVTPHEFVSVVITEKGVLPCTSAPAVLRVRDTK